MRAEQALDEMALLRMKLTQPFTRHVIDGWFAAVSKTQFTMNGSHLADVELSRLTRADAYFISKDMSAVIEHAATLLDDSDLFVGDLWPCETGFVWIDGGFEVHDHRGESSIIKALMWSRTNNHGHIGSWVSMYGALDHEGDSVARWVKEAYPERVNDLGHIQMANIGFLPDQQSVGPPRLSHEYSDDMGIILTHGDGSPVTGSADNHMRYILAMLMMFEQSITAKTQTMPDRASGKRWRRASVPDRVTVIALRRTSHAQYGESDVEWRHRWVVRGHWRWQPYGGRSTACEHVMGSPVVENGRRTSYCVKEGCDHHVERLWIAPYIKGPDDAPIKVTDKINALVR